MKPKHYDLVNTALGDHVLYTVEECSEQIHCIFDEDNECKKNISDRKPLRGPQAVDIYSEALGRIITRPITIEANDNLFEIPSKSPNESAGGNPREPGDNLIQLQNTNTSRLCENNIPSTSTGNRASVSFNKNRAVVPFRFNCCNKQTKVVVCVHCGGAYHRDCYNKLGGAMRTNDARITCCTEPTDHKMENELRKKIIQEMDEKSEVMRENRELLKARVDSLEKSNFPQNELVKNLVQAMDDKCKVLTENRTLLYEKISYLEQKKEQPPQSAVSLFQKLLSSEIFKQCVALLESDPALNQEINVNNRSESSLTRNRLFNNQGNAALLNLENNIAVTTADGLNNESNKTLIGLCNERPVVVGSAGNSEENNGLSNSLLSMVNTGSKNLQKSIGSDKFNYLIRKGLQKRRLLSSTKCRKQIVKKRVSQPTKTRHLLFKKRRPNLPQKPKNDASESTISSESLLPICDKSNTPTTPIKLAALHENIVSRNQSVHNNLESSSATINQEPQNSSSFDSLGTHSNLEHSLESKSQTTHNDKLPIPLGDKSEKEITKASSDKASPEKFNNNNILNRTDTIKKTCQNTNQLQGVNSANDTTELVNNQEMNSVLKVTSSELPNNQDVVSLDLINNLQKVQNDNTFQGETIDTGVENTNKSHKLNDKEQTGSKKQVNNDIDPSTNQSLPLNNIPLTPKEIDSCNKQNHGTKMGPTELQMDTQYQKENVIPPDENNKIGENRINKTIPNKNTNMNDVFSDNQKETETISNNSTGIVENLPSETKSIQENSIEDKHSLLAQIKSIIADIPIENKKAKENISLVQLCQTKKTVSPDKPKTVSEEPPKKVMPSLKKKKMSPVEKLLSNRKKVGQIQANQKSTAVSKDRKEPLLAEGIKNNFTNTVGFSSFRKSKYTIQSIGNENEKSMGDRLYEVINKIQNKRKTPLKTQIINKTPMKSVVVNKSPLKSATIKKIPTKRPTTLTKKLSILQKKKKKVLPRPKEHQQSTRQKETNKEKIPVHKDDLIEEKEKLKLNNINESTPTNDQDKTTIENSMITPNKSTDVVEDQSISGSEDLLKEAYRRNVSSEEECSGMYSEIEIDEVSIENEDEDCLWKPSDVKIKVHSDHEQGESEQNDDYIVEDYTLHDDQGNEDDETSDYPDDSLDDLIYVNEEIVNASMDEEESNPISGFKEGVKKEDDFLLDEDTMPEAESIIAENCSHPVQCKEEEPGITPEQEEQLHIDTLLHHEIKIESEGGDTEMDVNKNADLNYSPIYDFLPPLSKSFNKNVTSTPKTIEQNKDNKNICVSKTGINNSISTPLANIAMGSKNTPEKNASLPLSKERDEKCTEDKKIQDSSAARVLNFQENHDTGETSLHKPEAAGINLLQVISLANNNSLSTNIYKETDSKGSHVTAINEEPCSELPKKITVNELAVLEGVSKKISTEVVESIDCNKEKGEEKNMIAENPIGSVGSGTLNKKVKAVSSLKKLKKKKSLPSTSQSKAGDKVESSARKVGKALQPDTITPSSSKNMTAIPSRPDNSTLSNIVEIASVLNNPLIITPNFPDNIPISRNPQIFTSLPSAINSNQTSILTPHFQRPYLLSSIPSTSKHPVVVRPYCWTYRTPHNMGLINSTLDARATMNVSQTGQEPSANQDGGSTPNEGGSSNRRWNIQVRTDLTDNSRSLLDDESQSINQESLADPNRRWNIHVRTDLVQRNDDLGETPGLIQVRRDLIQTGDDVSRMSGQIQVRRDLVESTAGPSRQLTVRSDLMESAPNLIEPQIAVRTDLVQAAGETSGQIKIRSDLLPVVENVPETSGLIQVRTDLVERPDNAAEGTSQSSEIAEAGSSSVQGDSRGQQNKRWKINVRKDLQQPIEVTPPALNEAALPLNLCLQEVTSNPNILPLNEMEATNNQPINANEPLLNIDGNKQYIKVRKDLGVNVEGQGSLDGPINIISETTLDQEDCPIITESVNALKNKTWGIKVRKDLGQTFDNGDESALTDLVGPSQLIDGKNTSSLEADDHVNSECVSQQDATVEVTKTTCLTPEMNNKNQIPVDVTLNNEVQDNQEDGKTSGKRWSIKVRTDLRQDSELTMTTQDAVVGTKSSPEINQNNSSLATTIETICTSVKATPAISAAEEERLLGTHEPSLSATEIDPAETASKDNENILRNAPSNTVESILQETVSDEQVMLEVGEDANIVKETTNPEEELLKESEPVKESSKSKSAQVSLLIEEGAKVLNESQKDEEILNKLQSNDETVAIGAINISESQNDEDILRDSEIDEDKVLNEFQNDEDDIWKETEIDEETLLNKTHLDQEDSAIVKSNEATRISSDLPESKNTPNNNVKDLRPELVAKNQSNSSEPLMKKSIDSLAEKLALHIESKLKNNPPCSGIEGNKATSGKEILPNDNNDSTVKESGLDASATCVSNKIKDGIEVTLTPSERVNEAEKMDDSINNKDKITTKVAERQSLIKKEVQGISTNRQGEILTTRDTQKAPNFSLDFEVPNLMDEQFPKNSTINVSNYLKRTPTANDNQDNPAKSISSHIQPGPSSLCKETILKPKVEIEEGEITSSSDEATLVIDESKCTSKKRRNRSEEKSLHNSAMGLHDKTTVINADSAKKRRRPSRKQRKSKEAKDLQCTDINNSQRSRRSDTKKPQVPDLKNSQCTKNKIESNQKLFTPTNEKSDKLLATEGSQFEMVYDPIDTTLGENVQFQIETFSEHIDCNHDSIKSYKKISWNKSILRSRTRMVEIYVDILEKNITRPITVDANDNIFEFISRNCNSNVSKSKSPSNQTGNNEGMMNKQLRSNQRSSRIVHDNSKNKNKLLSVENKNINVKKNCDKSFNQPSSSRTHTANKKADESDLMDYCLQLGGRKRKATHEPETQESRSPKKLLRKIDVDKFLDMIHNSKSTSF